MYSKVPFRENFWKELTQERITSIVNEVKGKSESMLGQDLVDNLTAKYILKPLAFDWVNVEKKIVDIKVPGNQFPRTYDVSRGVSYNVQAGSYKIPFTGDDILMTIKMDLPRMNVYDINYDKNSMTLIITNLSMLDGNNAALEKVRVEFERAKAGFETVIEYINKEVKRFNAELPQLIEKNVQLEKEARQQRRDSESKL